MCRDGYIYPSYDIMEDYKNPMPGESPFYTDFLYRIQESYPGKYGLDQCTWNPAWLHLNTHKDELVKLFNEHFHYREIGQETESRWQYFLQMTLDMVGPKFDHAFEMYETNDVNDLGLGYEETEDYTRNYTRTEHAESTDTDTSKYKDTPTSVAGINNPTTQTDNNGTSEGDSTRTDTESYNRAHKKTQHDQHTITEVNTNITVWRNIANEFVLAFEPCFIQLLQ